MYVCLFDSLVLLSNMFPSMQLILSYTYQWPQMMLLMPLSSTLEIRPIFFDC